MSRNLFSLLNPELFVLDPRTSIDDEFIITKTLETIVVQRGIDLLPYLARHLAGDPGEVLDEDRSSVLYDHTIEWQGHYSAFSIDGLRVVFSSSKSRRVTFAALPEDAETD